MGKRRDRFDLRALKQKESRSLNGPRKAEERERRRQRMLAELRAGSPPYPRVVRGWLAAELGKPEATVTKDDVKKLLADAKS
jgi:hypothetical protein